MTEPTEQKMVRFIIFAPKGTKLYGLGEAIDVLTNHAWAEVICTDDSQLVCSELFAKNVDGLVLLRPKEDGIPVIEQILAQWSSVDPEGVHVLLLVDWPTDREAHFYAYMWPQPIRLYIGLSGLPGKFFSFGELVRSGIR